MPPQEPSSGYGGEPAVRENASIFAVLRRRVVVILLTTLLAGAASAAVVYLQDDTYESTAKLLFRQTIGAELNAIGFLPGAPDADNLAADSVEIVDSRRVDVATSRRLRERGIDMSADDVDNDVTVFAPKDTEVVDVTATADSAERAALVANVYAQEAARLAELDQRRLAERALDSVNQQVRTVDDPRVAETLREDAARLRTLASVGTGSPQIIQPGYAPEGESGNPMQTIVLGVLLGVVLGVGLALLREQSDRRLHRAEQVSAAFEAPVLTTVPRNRKLKRHKPYAELPSEVAEAFRMLQMNLRFGQPTPVRSVLITSPRAREGKTTIAWNLASAAAQAGLSVALVEADMRRPSLAQRYGLEPESGLAETLRGEVSVAASLQSVFATSESAATNGHAAPMHVLVAGRPPADPWALMQSPVMARVLEILTRDHALVVIDTPPISHVADAISLLRRVDGVLVVASVNSTRGPEAGRLRHQLETLDARVLGVVANGGSPMNGYAYVPPTATTASQG